MRLGVFLPNWVGDVVMATPALRALRTHVGRRRRWSASCGRMWPRCSRGATWFDETIVYAKRRRRELQCADGAASAAREARRGRAADQLAAHGVDGVSQRGPRADRHGGQSAVAAAHDARLPAAARLAAGVPADGGRVSAGRPGRRSAAGGADAGTGHDARPTSSWPTACGGGSAGGERARGGVQHGRSVRRRQGLAGRAFCGAGPAAGVERDWHVLVNCGPERAASGAEHRRGGGRRARGEPGGRAGAADRADQGGRSAARGCS